MSQSLTWVAVLDAKNWHYNDHCKEPVGEPTYPSTHYNS